VHDSVVYSQHGDACARFVCSTQDKERWTRLLQRSSREIDVQAEMQETARLFNASQGNSAKCVHGGW
jgi:hypothetical protein